MKSTHFLDVNFYFPTGNNFEILAKAERTVYKPKFLFNSSQFPSFLENFNIKSASWVDYCILYWGSSSSFFTRWACTGRQTFQPVINKHNPNSLSTELNQKLFLFPLPIIQKYLSTNIKTGFRFTCRQRNVKGQPIFSFCSCIPCHLQSLQHHQENCKQSTLLFKKTH